MIRTIRRYYEKMAWLTGAAVIWLNHETCEIEIEWPPEFGGG